VERDVASDEGPGAGASAAETLVAAITNMAMTKVKKSFIFNASIAQSYVFFSFSSFFVASARRGFWFGSWKTWCAIGWSYIDAGREKRRAAVHTFSLATGSRLPGSRTCPICWTECLHSISFCDTAVANGLWGYPSL